MHNDYRAPKSIIMSSSRFLCCRVRLGRGRHRIPLHELLDLGNKLGNAEWLRHYVVLEYGVSKIFPSDMEEFSA